MTSQAKLSLALGLAVAIAVAAVLLSGGDDDAGGADVSETNAATEVGCEFAEAPEAKDLALPAPTAKTPTASTVVFETSCGSFTVTLDAENAPLTAASVEYLAGEGVYDGVGFTRIAPGFVIQGGDPTETRAGSAGYSITEKPPADTAYTKGVVAMAKSGVEPPGTSGSQFFVVTGADAGLPPDYAVVGEVTAGFETIEKIESVGTADGSGDGPAAAPVVINSATPG